ncbi:hypothetical protein KIPB_013856, partial [Kipferlia bialata]|eukprot:g13856.t1
MGGVSWGKQFYALLVKQIHINRRDITSLLLQLIILPAIMMYLIVFFDSLMSS